MARGHLAFSQAGTRTAVQIAYAESPLRFLTPRNHGSAAWAYTSMTRGVGVEEIASYLLRAAGKAA